MKKDFLAKELVTELKDQLKNTYIIEYTPQIDHTKIYFHVVANKIKLYELPVEGSIIFFDDVPEEEYYMKVEKVEKGTIKACMVEKVKKFTKSPNRGYVYPSYIIEKRKHLSGDKEINGILIHLEQEYPYEWGKKDPTKKEVIEEIVTVRNDIIINPSNYGDRELGKRIANAFKKDL